ncbi:hypothetical protein [Paenibacillus xylanexedens]|uniref:hypothetical protein n=1 Tax=Paenibacillus xylanexedens TaxID=528191 RepID=UPI003B0156FA
MNEPKTPNLGLNKIDRSSPSTTYFDLDKYLDQNWEKVEEGVGQVEEKAEETAEQVRSIQERLDTEKRRSVTLEPGLQIINAERASAFKLEGLKGRTLVNLLGRDGNFEEANNWSEFAGTKAVANNVITVTGNGSDINPQVSNNKFISSLTPKVGDKLFLRVRATPVVGTVQQLQLYLYSAILSRVTAKNISNPLNGTTYDMYGSITVTQAIVDGWNSSLGLKLAATYATVAASNGSQVQYSQAAIYKISEADLSLTDDQVAAKYPYVDSVQPVRNPYAIRYGENLLPPFYEWDIQGIPHSITSSYEIVRSATDDLFNGASLTVKVPVISGNTYTLNYEIIGDVTKAYINWSWNDKDDNRISWTDGNKDTVTAVAPNDAVTAVVRVTGTAPGTFTFKNPMLTIGTTVKPFKPRKDDMFALQTELYANPLTGTNADEVFEKDGKYLKLSKWEKITFNSNYSYTFFNSYTGGKCVRLMYDITERNKKELPIVTKFNGSYLSVGSPSLFVDQYSRGDWDTGTGGAFLGIGVSTADSGWGDSYTPTADEIKAYFMGWVMTTQESWSSAPVPYNGTGTKGWVRRWINESQGVLRTVGTIGNWVDMSATPTLPTTMSEAFTPYQLLYQLTKPVVEPIASEGQLTLIEDNNQFEIGTGIVLREKANPRKGADWYIGEIFGAGSRLKSAPLRFLNIYRDGNADFKWAKQSTGSTLQGSEMLRTIDTNYDKSATYTVTYLMLDKSALASFVGSIAENEKALLSDLNDIVQQGASSLSVVERFLSEALRTSIQQNKRNVWGPIE